MTGAEVERLALALDDDSFLEVADRLGQLAAVVRDRRIQRLRRGQPPGPLLHPDATDNEWRRWSQQLARKAGQEPGP